MLKIIDLTVRLPGPLASFYLAEDGHHVIKIEDINRPDPFEKANDEGDLFGVWYKKINAPKEVLKLNWQNESIRNEIHEIIANADIIILPHNVKLIDLLQLQQNIGRAQAIITLSASANDWNSLHDINVFGMLEIAKEHLKLTPSPPFLPLAAMSFSQNIARKALGLYLKALRKNERQIMPLNLVDEAKNAFNVLTPHREGPFLHDGAFPCYQFYKTKDNVYLALACVEEKFWNKFCEIFNLPFSAELRFDASGKTQKLIQDMFWGLTSFEVFEMIGQNEICLTRSVKA